MATAAALLAAAAPLAAQAPDGADKKFQLESKTADLANGLNVARKLCGTCHLTGEPPTSETAAADVPSFQSIANRADQSVNAVSVWLMAPHKPMPDSHLTRIEIRDLAGYILSLRTAK